MRARFLPPLLLLAAGCGDDLATVSGDLLEPDAATDVWVLGGEARAAVADGAFELRDLRGDTLYLRFSQGDSDEARMDVFGLPAGARLELQRVWIDDGLAFPSGVELDGGDVVRINGLRWGSPDRLPEEVDERATVLSVGRDEDALLVRPLREDLPDLRVVVTPGTLVRGEDAEPAELDDLSYGDSLTVVGLREQGFVVATELVLPRRAEERARRDPDPDPPRGAAGRDDRVDVAEASVERNEARGQGPPEGRGRGRGRGRGNR